MKKTLIAMLVLILCLSTAIGCGAKTSDEKISAKIILIDKDNAQYEYDIKCDNGATLRDALLQNGLIDEDEYSSMFIQTIDGHVANVFEDGCTWMPQDENGKQIMGTFDDITISAGQTITLQYYIVPDFD